MRLISFFVTSFDRPIRSAVALMVAVLLAGALLPDAARAQGIYERTIVAPVPDSSAYTVEKDLPYRTRAGETVRMDVFRPAGMKPCPP